MSQHDYTRYGCDRCGETVELLANSSPVLAGADNSPEGWERFVRRPLEQQQDGPEVERADVCDACAVEFKEWWESRRKQTVQAG